jgi:hypothetical protein
VPNDTQTLEDLLREWETETHSHYSPPPQHTPAAHAQRSNGKLAFSPPPIVREIGVMERLEPELQALRGRVETAELSFYERRLQLESEHQAKMQKPKRRFPGATISSARRRR